ncbi:cd36 antigen, putative [Pediculus humanus corporis]|uniref:Sensory neuron membrane protein 2 n=1 Tax=Pediculus humanus subsp. corporis TaxID=121224 RepID=E0W0U1_PEDHC|nr:cd36 antigen, putative [Pediculus humanus corporis]EEB19247.1 cd36 antigen, putative [Pediculus humanus corporis]
MLLALKENSESWERWENPPVDIYFNVYIFNVNNPEEILRGSLPKVTEYGPYVYKEKRSKKVLSVNEETGVIKYKDDISFEFDEESSGNLKEDDVYTVVNLQALILSQIVDNLKVINPVIKLVDTALNKIWPTENSNPMFIKTSVKEFLFGKLPLLCNQTSSVNNVDTKVICEAIRLIKSKTIVLDDLGKNVHSFSVFGYKNRTSDEVYEIDSGIYDITKIGTILSWNNMTTLNNWKGKSCNRISGTDATIFRPYLDMDGIDSINVFNGEICRSIKLTSDGYVHFKGVWGKRYIADKNVFASVLENDKNYCFCPGSIKKLTHVNGCLKSGILDLSSCQGLNVVVV